MTINDLRVLVENLDEYIHIPGGIERLKKTVLHLAVSGQLVPQIMGEGTGEELYQQIQIRHKPKKALPKIEDNEKLFDIPSSWLWVRPINVGEINPRNAVDDDTTVGFTSMAMISEDYGVEPKHEERQWKEVKKNLTHIATGDVVLAKITPCFENSKAGIIGDMPNKVGAATTEVHVFRQEGNLVNHEYMYLWLKTPTYLKIGETKMMGTAGQKRVPTDFFASFIMPLPPLAEQQRIVKKVDEIFALIDELDGKYKAEEAERSKFVRSSLQALSHTGSRLALDNLASTIRTKTDAAELRKAILHLAVSGQLAPQIPSEGTGAELYKVIQATKADLISQGKLKKQKPLPTVTDDEIPFAIPESWKWVRLADIYDVRDGTHDTPKYVAKGYPLITSKNLSSGRLSFDDVKLISEADYLKIKERSQVSRNDILFAMIGSIGNPVIVDTDDEFAIKNVALFKPIGEYYNPQWLLSLLELFTSAMKEQSAGGVQAFVPLSFLRNYPIPLPPLPEQKRIVTKTTELLNLVSSFEYALESKRAQTAAPVEQTTPQWFAIKQGVGALLEKLAQTQYERGEMVIAKYMYLMQEVYKVAFGLQFVKHRFGPYDPAIKRAILSSAFKKDKFFKVEGSGDKQVYSLGDNISTLMKYDSDALTGSRDALQDLMQYTNQAKSSDIERLATVCKIIQDAQTTDEDTVLSEMAKWKSNKFKNEDTKRSLKFILQKGWDKKLIEK